MSARSARPGNTRAGGALAPAWTKKSRVPKAKGLWQEAAQREMIIRAGCALGEHGLTAVEHVKHGGNAIPQPKGANVVCA